MTTPTITRTPAGNLILTFPYDAALIDAVKDAIPAHGRKYDPAVKSWTISAAHAGMATRLMYQAFGDVEIVDAGAGPSFDRDDRVDDSDAWRILHLLPTAPPELVTAAHKCLARLHHPDAGGNTAAMQAINNAADRIRDAR